MVFDDFNGVDKKDILFMKHLFPIFKANDVLLFVLVRDEATANQLLELNGWGRIAPLQGICNDVCSPGDKGGNARMEIRPVDTRPACSVQIWWYSKEHD